jgi:hypothetical protein
MNLRPNSHFKDFKFHFITMSSLRVYLNRERSTSSTLSCVLYPFTLRSARNIF